MKNEKVINQFFVPHNILDEGKFKKMKKSSQLLYIYMCKLKNRHGDGFYKHIEDFQKETNMGLSTIRKAKQQLIDKKYINVKRDFYLHGGYRSADRYYLNGYKYQDSNVHFK